MNLGNPTLGEQKKLLNAVCKFICAFAKARLSTSFNQSNSFLYCAGVLFNFILAIVIFFFLGLVSGTPSKHAYISELEKGMPAYNSGLVKGDKITKIK